MIEGDEDIGLSEIILMEILQGIKNDRQHEEIKEYLLAFPLLKITPVQSYIHASDIYRRCRKKGMTIRKPLDCLISAAAIESNAVLFHNDADFQKIAEATVLRLHKA